MDPNMTSDENSTHVEMTNMNGSNLASDIKYWLDGPIGITLASIGLVSNIVAITMLMRQRVQRNFHMMMIFLSMWDFGYLVLSICCFSLPLLSTYFRENLYIYMIPYAIPLAQICLSGSCYSTVALTIERYVAVCAPFFRLKYNIRASLYMLPIAIFAPLYNLPRFFEFRTVTNVTYTCVDHLYNASSEPKSMVVDEETFSNISGSNLDIGCDHWSRRSFVHLVVTDFRTDHIYVMVYMNYVNLIVNLILPMLLLGVLNCLVYKALKKNIGPNLSIRRNRGKHEDALRKRDIRLTRIAIIIVCVFICCHLPRFVPNVVEMFMPQLSESLKVLISVNNVLQIINCTVNYMIYYGHCWRVKRTENSPSIGDRGGNRFDLCVLANGSQTRIELDSRFKANA